MFSEQAVIVYDNVNFKDKKCDEVVGHTTTIWAIIMAAIVLCPELPLLGLYQGMHNPIIPLRLKNILNAPSISGENNKIGVNIT